MTIFLAIMYSIYLYDGPLPNLFFSFICLFTKNILYTIYKSGSRITVFRDAGVIIYPLAGNIKARG
jgi:hypothetical protein